jgi:uncharacterized protein (TIGR00369 family)
MMKSRPAPTLAPDLLERLRARFHDFPLTQDWPLAIEGLQPGQATVRLDPSERITNRPGGAMNGGVLATLADIACAMALCTYFDGRMPFATSDLHIRYLEPADSQVRAEASVIRASPRSAILECRLLAGGRIVGLATAHFAIRQKASGE